MVGSEWSKSEESIDKSIEKAAPKKIMKEGTEEMIVPRKMNYLEQRNFDERSKFKTERVQSGGPKHHNNPSFVQFESNNVSLQQQNEEQGDENKGLFDKSKGLIDYKNVQKMFIREKLQSLKEQ